MFYKYSCRYLFIFQLNYRNKQLFEHKFVLFWILQLRNLFLQFMQLTTGSWNWNRARCPNKACFGETFTKLYWLRHSVRMTSLIARGFNKTKSFFSLFVKVLKCCNCATKYVIFYNMLEMNKHCYYYCIQTPKLWNELPTDLKTSTSRYQNLCI